MNKKEIATRFVEDMRREHPEVRIASCQYVTIDDNNHSDFSDYAYNVEAAKYTIVCCKYYYTVISQMDSSSFVLFIDENGHADSKLKIGSWTITMDTPYTSNWRTDNGRVMYATYNDLKFELGLKNHKLAEDIVNKWPYLIKAMQCSTQRELNYLSKLVYQEDNIEEIKQINLRRELELSEKTDLINSYKGLLDEIKRIVLKDDFNS